MDTRTGEIYNAQFNERIQELKRQGVLKEVDETFLPGRVREELTETGRSKIGRNEACPCGSGRKFKLCCLDKDHREHFANPVQPTT